MSTYDYFLKAVKEDIIKFLPNEYKDCTIQIKKISKNNNTHLQGLIISQKGNSVFPTIYLEHFYERYQQGESFESILNKIVDIYISANVVNPIKEELIYNKVNIENVIFTLVNREKNQEMLRNAPYMNCSYNDELVFVFRILFFVDGFANALVTHKLAEEKGWGIDLLYNTARKNTPKLLPVCIESINNILHELIIGTTEDDKTLNPLKHEFDDFDTMYIVSNTEKTYGACAVYYPEVLERLSEVLLSEKLVLLPSSIHEMIVIPYGAIEVSYLEDMVKEVNESTVSPEEFLGQKVIIYHNKK